MHIYLKTMLFCMSVAVVLEFAPNNSAAQSTGPAAFAAKQQVKALALTAMADGKITQDERRNILLKAKNVCTANEYIGLVETINRLSPPDHATPENLGYATYTDKQLMAQFPTPDLSWIAKSPISNVIPKQSFPKETMPKQNVVVKETITTQTIVKETIPQKSIVKGTKPKPKQTVVKTTKPQVTSKVVVISSPAQRKNNKQSGRSSAKPVQQKMAETSKKRPVVGDQASIQKPAKSWDAAEKLATICSYADHSVPAPTTPTAASISDRNKSNIIKASYEQPLEPEACQSIIRQ